MMANSSDSEWLRGGVGHGGRVALWIIGMIVRGLGVWVMDRQMDRQTDGRTNGHLRFLAFTDLRDLRDQRDQRDIRDKIF